MTLQLKKIRFYYQRTEYELEIPAHWPDDCLPEICAFRIGLRAGDIFEFISDVGVTTLITTGRSG